MAYVSIIIVSESAALSQRMLAYLGRTVSAICYHFFTLRSIRCQFLCLFFIGKAPLRN